MNKQQSAAENSANENRTDGTEDLTHESVHSGENETEESPLELVKAELNMANDKFLRLYSDFENYKKRTFKERMDLMKTAGADVIISLLPVLDDFERAVRSMENNKDIDALKEGVVLIQNKLKGILTQKGLQVIDSLNKPFDTDVHEAVTNIPAVDKAKKGLVVDELEKGYMMNDKVIRHAKVVVSM